MELVGQKRLGSQGKKSSSRAAALPRAREVTGRRARVSEEGHNLHGHGRYPLLQEREREQLGAVLCITQGTCT